jgi:hypothetical protein
MYVCRSLLPSAWLCCVCICLHESVLTQYALCFCFIPAKGLKLTTVYRVFGRVLLCCGVLCYIVLCLVNQDMAEIVEPVVGAALLGGLTREELVTSECSTRVINSLVFKREKQQRAKRPSIALARKKSVLHALPSPIVEQCITENGSRQLRLLDFSAKAKEHRSSVHCFPTLAIIPDSIDKLFSDEIVHIRPNNSPFIDKIYDLPSYVQSTYLPPKHKH